MPETRPGPQKLRRYLDSKSGRRAGGITGLAKLIGVSRAAVYYWLQGVQSPTRDHERAIADATNNRVPKGSW